MRLHRNSLLAAGLALAVAGAASTANAAPVYTVKVTGGTLVNGTYSDNAISIQPGGTVTVSVYINGLDDYGLAGFSLSLKSYGETYNNGTAFPSTTATDTVVNATSGGLASAVTSVFTTGINNGNIVDLSTGDTNDTDKDVRAAGAAQLSVGTAGLAQGSSLYLLGSWTFTALAVPSRALGQTVNINVVTGSGDGVATVKRFTASAPGSGSTSYLASQITAAAPVVVTVANPTSEVPLPAAAWSGLAMLGAVGAFRLRRR